MDVFRDARPLPTPLRSGGDLLFTWTLDVPRSVRSKALLKRLLKAPVAYPRLLARLRGVCDACRCRPVLRDMFERVLALKEREPIATSAAVDGFLVEFVAGIEYARTSPRAGRLENLLSLVGHAGCAPCFARLLAFCTSALREPLARDTWFRLRAACMDAYVLGCLLCADADTIVCYAGDAHVRALRDALVAMGAETARTVPSIVSECDLDTLLRVEALDLDGRSVVLLGENHASTAAVVADDLLALLKSQCASGDGGDMVFLVEQHISNPDRSDEVPRRVMCNQQDEFAIQRFRCDAFVDSSAHLACPNLRIVQVDSRHADLGFLRMELMDVWDEDDEFRRIATHFTRAALESVLNVCRVALATTPTAASPT